MIIIGYYQFHAIHHCSEQLSLRDKHALEHQHISAEVKLGGIEDRCHMSEAKLQLTENGEQMIYHSDYHFKSDFYLLISGFLVSLWFSSQQY